jgi:hypothetical protein
VTVLLDEPLNGGRVNSQGRRQGFQKVFRGSPLTFETAMRFAPFETFR